MSISHVPPAGLLERHLAVVDPEIDAAIQGELTRQRDNLELIASENYTSRAVLEAVCSVLTNKYAEGYPGRRYYGGCVNVDRAESLAISRAKALFSPKDPEAIHANVQPHAGSQANTAVYLACLKPGDTLMGMSLAHGGHLTHGHPLSISGKLYRVVSYGVSKETETIDWDAFQATAEAEKPKLIIAGASAYPRTLDFPRFLKIADSVGALLMVNMAHIAGLVAAGDVRHVDHEERADGVRDLPKARKVERARVGGRARDAELRLLGLGRRLEGVPVDRLGLLRDAVRDDAVKLPRDRERVPVREVPAVGERHAEKLSLI